MDAEKLIEEATEIAAQTATQGDLESEYPPCNCSAPPRGHTMRRHDYRRLQVDELRAVLDVVSRMTAALRETTARADRQKQQFDEALGDLMDAHAEEIRKRGLSNAVTAETYDACHAALRQTEEERDRERKRADVVAAANVAANKRIAALEHERDERNELIDGHTMDLGKRLIQTLTAERDAARAELARLTTPRPIAEAPKDGAWIGAIWEDMDAEDCQRYGPIAVVKWRGTGWEDSDGDGYEPPSHFLPLPVLP